MFVAVHNLSNFSGLDGIVVFYPDAPNDATGYVTTMGFSVGRVGTTQILLNSLSQTPNHGSVHILLFDQADADVQTYGYSTTAGTFNVFTPFRPNHGSGNTVN
jgi:hypothetical protein